jgi:hypothetical protein
MEMSDVAKETSFKLKRGQLTPTSVASPLVPRWRASNTAPIIPPTTAPPMEAGTNKIYAKANMPKIAPDIKSGAEWQGAARPRPPKTNPTTGSETPPASVPISAPARTFIEIPPATTCRK